MSFPLVVLTLVAPPDMLRHERKAAVVLDSGSGQFVAIERYSSGTLTEALERLQYVFWNPLARKLSASDVGPTKATSSG